jgi:antitoxin HicB
MFPYRIHIEWSPDDEVYVSRVPAFPGVAAHGATPEEAAHEARVATEGVIACMSDHGEKVPEPDLIGSDFSGNIRLRLPKSLHRRLAERAAEEGISLNQIMLMMLSAGEALPPRRRVSEGAPKKMRHASG